MSEPGQPEGEQPQLSPQERLHQRAEAIRQRQEAAQAGPDEDKEPAGHTAFDRLLREIRQEEAQSQRPAQAEPQPAQRQLRQRLAAVAPDVRQAGKRIKLPVKAREAAKQAATAGRRVVEYGALMPVLALQRAQENVVGLISSRGTATRQAIKERFEKKELSFAKEEDVDRFFKEIGGGEVIPYGRAGGDVKASLAIGAVGAAGRRLAFETLGKTVLTVAPLAAILTVSRDVRTVLSGRGKGLAALSEKYTAERYGLLGKVASGVQVVERKVAARATRTESTALTDEVLKLVNGKIEELIQKGEDSSAYRSSKDQLRADILKIADTSQSRIEAFGTLNRAKIFNNYRDLERGLRDRGLSLLTRMDLERIRGVLFEAIGEEIKEVWKSEGGDSARFNSLVGEVGRYQVGKKEYYGKVAAIMTASATMSAARSLVGLGIGEVFAAGYEDLAEHFRAGGSIGFSIPGVRRIRLGPAGAPEATEAPTEAPGLAATETATGTPEPTTAPTATATPTPSPTATEAATAPPTATGTPEPSPTATATATPTPTAEVTPPPAVTPEATPAAEAAQPAAPPVAGGEVIAQAGTEDMPKGLPEAPPAEQPEAVPSEEAAAAAPEPEPTEAETEPAPAAVTEAEEPFFHPEEGEYPWSTGAKEGAKWAAESGLPDTIDLGIGDRPLDTVDAASNLTGWARAWEPDLTQKEGEELFGWFGRAMSWAQENPEEFRNLHVEPLSVAFNPAKLEAAMMAIEDPDARRMVATSMISNGMIPQEHEASRKLLWEIIRGRR